MHIHNSFYSQGVQFSFINLEGCFFYFKSFNCFFVNFFFCTESTDWLVFFLFSYFVFVFFFKLKNFFFLFFGLDILFVVSFYFIFLIFNRNLIILKYFFKNIFFFGSMIKTM